MEYPSRSAIAQRGVLVAGDIMLDRYWFGDVDRISPEAPVPIVAIRETDERLGGAANVARNMSALGANAGSLAVLGRDEAASCVHSLLAESSIEAHLHEENGLATTVKLRILGRRQQMLRADFESRPDRDVLLDRLGNYRGLLAQYDLIALSDYSKGGLAHIVEMISVARAAGKRVLVDLKGDDYSVCRRATLVTPNLAELRAVVGRWRNKEDLARRAQALRAGLEMEPLLLAHSEGGMTLYIADGQRSEPTQAREDFDVSDAGDTVLADMLAAELDLWDAVQIANRAGGIVVGKVGTATVSYDELFGTSS